jgi:hypothetical protein
MPISIHPSSRKSDPRICELCSAIGDQLPASYLPALAEPLPRELKGLIAQLVELEMRDRGSRPVETLRSVMAQLAAPPQPPDRSGRKTDKMG